MAINVLGLSFGHDGGACVVKDGKAKNYSKRIKKISLLLMIMA